MAGKGFKQLAQGLIHVGAKHGRVSVDAVLPHPATVSKKTSDVADRVRQQFLPEVMGALKEGTCAFETDLWTDKYTKRAYLTLDCQYSTSDFDIKSLTLFTIEFPAEQKKTGSNIRKLMESELVSLGFSLADVKNATFNTDEGANVKKALEGYKRLNCTAHVLATVLRTIFDVHKKNSAQSFLFKNAPAIHVCILACKRMAVYIKRSGKNLRLSRGVKLMVETRWNTLVDMLRSVVESDEEIREILTESGETEKMNGWDVDLARELIDFLTPFQKVSVELQAKKTPTLHLVLIRREELLKHCTVDDNTDHEVITYLQMLFLDFFFSFFF